ncbi:MAG: tetratricopeptide repeat protein [Candidatus Obscuribacterales bacterium]|nr:tetratricopeptide repeat protein [Candidatus Obscuribacterales bacterium]
MINKKRIVQLSVAGSLLFSALVAPTLAGLARYSDNDQAEAFYKKGCHLMTAGRYKEAVPEYREAIRLDERFVAANINLALSLNKLGQYKEAVARATAALKYNPWSDYAFVHRARAYEGLGQNDKAIKDWTQAIANDRDNPGYYYDRSRCWTKLNNKAEAEKDQRKVLSMPASSAYAKELQGRLYLDRKDFKTAISLFTAAYEEDPRAIVVLHDRGLCNASLGNYKAAMDDYNTCLKSDPKYSHCYYLRGVAQMASGNMKQGAADLRTFLTQSNWNPPHAIYAVAYCALADRRNNNESGASALLKECRKRDPMNQWPSGVIRYLSGETSADEVLKEANTNDLLTEAKAYIGFDLITKGKKSEGLQHLKWVKDNGNKSFSEYQVSVAELRRMVANAPKKSG